MATDTAENEGIQRRQYRRERATMDPQQVIDVVSSPSSSSSARPLTALGKQVKFNEAVESYEFARLLGGSGGVPTDGTWAALGLGQALGCVVARLVFDDPSAETKEAVQIPQRKRIQMLSQAMGHAYDEIRKAERSEMQKLQKRRDKSVDEDDSEWQQMPVDGDEARQRAVELAKEVAAEAHEGRRGGRHARSGRQGGGQRAAAERPAPAPAREVALPRKDALKDAPETAAPEVPLKAPREEVPKAPPTSWADSLEEEASRFPEAGDLEAPGAFLEPLPIAAEEAPSPSAEIEPREEVLTADLRVEEHLEHMVELEEPPAADAVVEAEVESPLAARELPPLHAAQRVAEESRLHAPQNVVEVFIGTPRSDAPEEASNGEPLSPGTAKVAAEDRGALFWEERLDTPMMNGTTSQLEVGTPPREETNPVEAMLRPGGYPGEAPEPYQKPPHRKVLLRSNSPEQKPAKEVNGNTVKRPQRNAGSGREAPRAPRIMQRPQPARENQTSSVQVPVAPQPQPSAQHLSREQMADYVALAKMKPPPPPPTNQGSQALRQPPLRILQRDPVPEAEPAPTSPSPGEDEDDDEDLDDPVPNPRRSWRCAGAGKSERVGSARRMPRPAAKAVGRAAARPSQKAEKERPEKAEKLEKPEKPAEKKPPGRHWQSGVSGGAAPPPPPPPPPRPERRRETEALPTPPPPAPPAPPSEVQVSDSDGTEMVEPGSPGRPAPLQPSKTRRRGTRGGRGSLRRTNGSRPQATAAEWLDADREVTAEPLSNASWKPSLRPLEKSLRELRQI